MILKISHIAIAVKDLNQPVNFYKNILKCDVTKPHKYPNHGIECCFVHFQNINIELMSPITPNSPISFFLKKNYYGGIHHICFTVENLLSVRDKLISKGIEVIGDGVPQIGSRDKKIIFLRPKFCQGTLIELESDK